MAGKHSTKLKDLTGKSFGRLTVLERAANAGAHVRWSCRCECGNAKVVQGASLRSGATKSCGCLSREIAAARARTHGLTHLAEHSTWYGMLTRCRNPKSTNYANYGGRGITVCQHWEKFEPFLEDMGPKPTPQHSIERRDNNLGYSKENCYWATRNEQNHNKRNNKRIYFHGITMTLAEWAKHLGVSRQTIASRLKVGWSLGKAFSPMAFDSKGRPLDMGAPR